MTLLYTVLLVGALVLVHELGHFAAAKAFGMRVLTFSLGFGPRVLGFRTRETEYRLSLVPVGGYVRLLGDGTEPVPRHEAHRAFPNQPAWKRMLVIVAGPTMNLVFPLLLFFVVHLGETRMAAPIVGTVFPDRPADGKLAPGDRIRAIDGHRVRTFEELADRVEESAGVPLRFELERDGETLTEVLRPVPTPRNHPLDLPGEVGRVGIIPHEPLPVVGVWSPDSPAARAGLRTFDVVASAGKEPTFHWRDVARVLEPNRGTLVPVTALRPTRVDDALGGLVQMDVYAPFVVQLAPEAGPGSGVRRAGIEPADLYVAHVAAGGTEHRLGVLPGDRLVALDGRPVRLWATFIEDLRRGDGVHELTWSHAGELRRATYRLQKERGETAHGQRFDRWVVGMRNWMPRRVSELVPNPRPVLRAVGEALDSTWEGVEVTVYSVVRLVQGRLSVRSLGGPLAIYEFTGVAAQEGTVDLLMAMAIISINLGLLNLLPVPILDGGHLLFVILELLRGRPVAARFWRTASVVGFALLLVLMLLAVRNDLYRLDASRPGVERLVE